MAIGSEDCLCIPLERPIGEYIDATVDLQDQDGENDEESVSQSVGRSVSHSIRRSVGQSVGRLSEVV
jgi:hypothetical protein